MEITRKVTARQVRVVSFSAPREIGSRQKPIVGLNARINRDGTIDMLSVTQGTVVPGATLSEAKVTRTTVKPGEKGWEKLTEARAEGMSPAHGVFKENVLDRFPTITDLDTPFEGNTVMRVHDYDSEITVTDLDFVGTIVPNFVDAKIGSAKLSTGIRGGKRPYVTQVEARDADGKLVRLSDQGFRSLVDMLKGSGVLSDKVVIAG